MNRSRVLFVLLLSTLAALLTGCGANVAILRQASPNPFAGQTSFAVMPLETNGLVVREKSEAEYLAERTGH